MDRDYICDDRGVYEHVKSILSMTDEEFEEYQKTRSERTSTEEPFDKDDEDN